MLKDVFFISMDGKKGFQIGDFSVRDDISLPVYVKEGETFTVDHLNPDNIVTGMIKVLTDDPENDNIDYYREFIYSVQPDIEARMSSVAYEAEKNHHFGEAINLFQVLLALNPEVIDHYLNLAVCYDELALYLTNKGNETEAGKYENLAYEYFKTVDEYENKSENALFYLGRFYLVRENYEKAVEYFREFLEESDDSERKQEVVQLLKEISIEGVNDENYQNAMSMVHADKDGEAIGFIDQFIQKHPNSWNAYYLKGIALRKLKKYDDSIQQFEIALKLNPDSGDIFNEMGIVYMHMGKHHKSEMYFDRSLQKNPDDASVLSNLAMNAFKKGDKETAVKYCEIILEFNPDDLNAKKLKKVIEENETS